MDPVRDEAGLGWTIARFRHCVLDRQRRELRRNGTGQPIEPRAFDVLVFLLDQRHRVVTRRDITAQCLRGEAASDGALARTVMKIRQAIGDFDADRPLVRTMPRVGYRFVGDVRLGAALAAPASAGPPVVAPVECGERRLALLPFKNDTVDVELAWVEFGLISSIGRALEHQPDLVIVPAQDVLVALAGCAPGAPLEHLLSVVESRLGTRLVGWGELSGAHGRYLLKFNLQSAHGSVQRGTVAGDDIATMAIAAAARMRAWLVCSDGAGTHASVDLGDPFLNEAFVLAVAHRRNNRLAEAEHLLEVLRDAGVCHEEVEHESIKLSVLLGRPDAGAGVESLKAHADRNGSPRLRVVARALRGLHLDQQARMAEAAQASREAFELADAHGLSSLAVQCMVACANRLGACFDDDAQALLSRAIARAERLGHPVLLVEAYLTAGRLAGFRNDWISAARHHEIALLVARHHDDALRFPSRSALALAQMHLGQLARAVDEAAHAHRIARKCGMQPALGLATLVLMQAYVADRRLREAAALYDSIPQSECVAMRVACEVHGRAPLLRANGRFDEALECLAVVSDAARSDAALHGACAVARLQVLAQARRFDELAETCEALRAQLPGRGDPHLAPWIERALALRERFALGNVDAALERLHRVGRTTPLCEVHAIASFEAAWLHLERGEANEARRVVEHLPAWTEQSPSGMQVAARLRYASGDWRGAAELQRRFMQRFPDCPTDCQIQILSAYERASVQGSGAAADLPILEEALDLHWAPREELRTLLSPALGGTLAP